MASHFADRLCDAVKTKKTSLIVGLDPVYNRLPSAIRNHRQMNDEFDAAAAVDAIFDFCTQAMRIVAPMVPLRFLHTGNANRCADGSRCEDKHCVF